MIPIEKGSKCNVNLAIVNLESRSSISSCSAKRHAQSVEMALTEDMTQTQKTIKQHTFGDCTQHHVFLIAHELLLV